MSSRLSIQQLIGLSLAVGLLAAFLAPGPTHAQEPTGSQGLWQTFTTANAGLRDNWVTALLEDRSGGVWVGTYGGVSRYFQGAWQTFSKESGSLGDSFFVNELLEDRAGGLWVGTYGSGVSRYFQGTWQIFSTETGSLGNNVVTALLEDRAGGVWVGTYGGVSRYFQGAWQTFPESGSVSGLLEDGAGGVWVGTYGGVSYHRPGSYRPWVLLRQLEVERRDRVQSYNLAGGNVPEVVLDFPVGRLTIRSPDEDDLIAIGDTLERLGIVSTDFAYLTDVERRVLQPSLKGSQFPLTLTPLFSTA